MELEQSKGNFLPLLLKLLRKRKTLENREIRKTKQSRTARSKANCQPRQV